MRGAIVGALLLLAGCGGVNPDLHFRPYGHGDLDGYPGRAKWREIAGEVLSCDIYIITPEEFSRLFPYGYRDKATGLPVLTWEDLYYHEDKHCQEGSYHD